MSCPISLIITDFKSKPQWSIGLHPLNKKNSRNPTKQELKSMGINKISYGLMSAAWQTRTSPAHVVPQKQIFSCYPTDKSTCMGALGAKQEVVQPWLSPGLKRVALRRHAHTQWQKHWQWPRLQARHSPNPMWTQHWCHFPRVLPPAPSAKGPMRSHPQLHHQHEACWRWTWLLFWCTSDLWPCCTMVQRQSCWPTDQPIDPVTVGTGTQWKPKPLVHGTRLAKHTVIFWKCEHLYTTNPDILLLLIQPMMILYIYTR